MDIQAEYIEAALKAISAVYRCLQGKRGRTIFCGLGGKDPAAFNIRIPENGRVRVWTYLTKELWDGASDAFRKMRFQKNAEAEIGIKVTGDGVLVYYYEEKFRGDGTAVTPDILPPFEDVLKDYLRLLDRLQIWLEVWEIPLLHERLNFFCEKRISQEAEKEPESKGERGYGNSSGFRDLFAELEDAFAGVIVDSSSPCPAPSDQLNQ